MKTDGSKRGRREDGTPPPSGPWSDLPPPEVRSPPRIRLPVGRSARRSPREPIISNWRGLLLVLFLLVVAPILARMAGGIIMGLIHGN